MPIIGEAGLTRDQAIDVAAQLQAEGFLALEERVGVIRDPAPDRTEGGLYLPDQSKNKPILGTVVMVGEGVTSDIRVGDRVSFTKYRPTRFELPLVNGDKVQVEVMHVADIYIRWGRL
jgi:chaperonin GroES